MQIWIGDTEITEHVEDVSIEMDCQTWDCQRWGCPHRVEARFLDGFVRLQHGLNPEHVRDFATPVNWDAIETWIRDCCEGH